MDGANKQGGEREEWRREMERKKWESGKKEYKDLKRVETGEKEGERRTGSR